MKLNFPRATVAKESDDWVVTLVFGGHWNNHPPVFIGAYSTQFVALDIASRTVKRERRRASFNPRYRYVSPRGRRLMLVLR